jgi:hypothetical protein
MFHPDHDPRIAAECYDHDRDPVWRVEHRPDGTYWWIVTDWTGTTVAHGIQMTIGSAVNEAVRWSTGQPAA